MRPPEEPLVKGVKEIQTACLSSKIASRVFSSQWFWGTRPKSRRLALNKFNVSLLLPKSGLFYYLPLANRNITLDIPSKSCTTDLLNIGAATLRVAFFTTYSTFSARTWICRKTAKPAGFRSLSNCNWTTETNNLKRFKASKTAAGTRPR